MSYLVRNSCHQNFFRLENLISHLFFFLFSRSKVTMKTISLNISWGRIRTSVDTFKNRKKIHNVSLSDF